MAEDFLFPKPFPKKTNQRNNQDQYVQQKVAERHGPNNVIQIINVLLQVIYAYVNGNKIPKPQQCNDGLPFKCGTAGLLVSACSHTAANNGGVYD